MGVWRHRTNWSHTSTRTGGGSSVVPAKRSNVPRGRIDGLCHVVSVVGTDGTVRLWPLWWGCSAAWQGPSMVDALPGRGLVRMRRYMIPESGVHVDVPNRAVGVGSPPRHAGSSTHCPIGGPIGGIEFWDDRYEEHIRRCRGALRVPELDLAAGVDAARDWLRKRVFQSFRGQSGGCDRRADENVGPART